MQNRQVFGVCLAMALLLGAVAFTIQDTFVNSEVINAGIQKGMNWKLQKLMETMFFKIFQVNIHKPCSLWESEQVCNSPGCIICECFDDEIPEAWRAENVVDTKLPVFTHWIEKDDNWIEQDSGDMTYIDLQRNPEGYTGYSGEGARRVWEAVYDTNCFTDTIPDMCYEQRVFYRLLSGFQGCTSAHIAMNFPIGDGDEWGPNPKLFERWVGAHPDRIHNIHFTFVFLLRAVHKISRQLETFDLQSGIQEEDERTRELLNAVLSDSLVRESDTKHGFDENLMFREMKMMPLKEQMRQHFRNISRIMDCVSCDKCKVHAKLQILGIGTALKIMFSEMDSISRNEVVALLNALAKFSQAIYITMEMQRMNSSFVWPQIIGICFIAVVTLWSCFLVCIRVVIVKQCRSPRRSPSPNQKKVN